MDQRSLQIVLKLQDQASNELRKVTGDLGNINTETKRANGSFASFAKNILAAAGAYVSLRSAYNAVSLGVKIAADLQTAEVGLTTLLGSVDEAAKTIARLKVEAARTPFELPGLTQATQLLTSVTKNGDKSIDILLNVGEALAAMGKGQAELDRIIVNLQQIASVGHAATIDIKQFAFSGIPIYEMLTETTGKAGEELSKFIEDGGVTFDVLTEMFDKANDAGGRFFNAFENQSGTFNQALSNMKDSFGIMMADIVQSSGLFEKLTDAMIFASNVMGDWRGTIDSVKQSFNDLMQRVDEKTGLISNLKGAWDNVVATFNETLRPAINDLWIALQPLLPYLEAMAQVIGAVLIGVLHLLIAAFTILANVLNFALTAITNLITFIVDTAVLVFHTLQNIIEFLAKVLMGDFVGAIDSVKQHIKDLIDWVKSLIEFLTRAIDLAKQIGGNVASTFKGATNFVGGLITGRASGGAVYGGTPYLVGESGPELFVPRTDGSIASNGQLAGAGSGGVNIIINGDVSGMELVEKVERALASKLKRVQRMS